MKTILLSPFERYSETALLSVGFTATLIFTYIAHLFQARLDGVLDLHFSPTAFPLKTSFIENGINIFCLTIFLFMAGKLINKRVRLVDILAVSLVARIPYYLISFLNLNNSMSIASEEILTAVNTEMLESISSSTITILIILALVALVALVWYITLLWTGFKVASNAKGSTHIIYFIGALILAEVMSKMLIFIIL